jgi:SAM-dependent methyltransferase
MDKQIESEFFDAFESKYGDYDVLGELAYKRLLDKFARYIKPRKGERCYDLGCGTGAFTRRLGKFDLQLTGIDISAGCINMAKQKGAGEEYQAGDLMNLDFGDNTADIIVYSGVLHHISEAAERNRALKEGLRVLKSGGRLFAYDPNAASPSMWLYRDSRSPLYSQEGKTENEVLLGRAQLYEELAAAGFTGIDVHGLSGTTFRFVESKTAQAILPIYNLYELVMMSTPLERSLGTFLISLAAKPEAESK